MVDFDAKIVDELEALIRNGQGEKVKDFILNTPLPTIPRVYKARIADLARRVGLHSKSLKILAPIVRPTKPVHPPATDSEKLIYAAALCRVGAYIEAFKIFQAIDSTLEPEVDFFKTYPYIANWDYKKVVQFINQYLKNSKVSPYRKFVGKVNLLAAYVFLRKTQLAKKLSTQLITGLTKGNHHLLLGNALELSCQLAIQSQDYTHAKKMLNAARPLLANSSQDDLYLNKWEVFTEYFAQPALASSESSLAKLNALALKRRDWETLREIDLYTSIFNNDVHLFKMVYFGTRSPFYRAHMIKSFPNRISIPNEFLWTKSKNDLNILDLHQLTYNDERLKVKRGGLLHRFLIYVSSDMYRPALIGQIHGELFPNEFYNPTSSPFKIHQIASRIKKVLQKQNINMDIRYFEYGYLIILGDALALKYRTLPLKIRNPKALSWSHFRKHNKRKYFGIHDLMKELQISRSTAKRLIRDAVAQSSLNKTGKGPATKYYFK